MPSILPTYVIGHKNPDADSICSAIAYAAFKEMRGEQGYVAARCGNSNARIDAIMERFHMPLPFYLSDVAARVHDVMATEVHTIAESATCAEALESIDRHGHRMVPVLADSGRVAGVITTAQLAHAFLPQIAEPKKMRLVTTDLESIARTLRGRTIHLGADPRRIEELFVRIGAMDTSSFWQLSQSEGIPAAQSIIVVGNRREIQERSIALGVRLLVISGNLAVEDAVVASARANGVSLIISPYDTATTAWLIRTAGRLSPIIERNFTPIKADVRLADIRRKIGTSTAAAFLVLADDGSLQGILSKSDVLKPVPTRLVLVDHNELTQAVSGAEDVTITEIIDHHRLAPITTSQPILFINEPVGSTCTIVADLFRRYHLQPTPDLAGIMMSGLISDTLLLQSPTSTPKDADVLAWLEPLADIKSRALADLIFSSGSVILANPPDKVVRSDFKIYTEEGVRFAVSQVEELGFDNFWSNAKPLAQALADLRTAERLVFAAVLITDINTQNSLMLVKGDGEFIRRISYTHVTQDEIFDLPGVVSRKKQLIPYLTGLVRELAEEGGGTRSRSGTPFRP
ncbi:MAG TPA: putative manganese-dependent inorganic diphosphatase [Candidatus Didemnitutus sp.]|nr:putative manganese-dependent inorganic diphosphatase [Candidatus Didemnitutus sp.]